VLQITSPAAGDGKSTLAANLSISLAQSGKKTILVESDFRRPTVHKLTGVANEIGIVQVLRGQAELADVIQPLKVDGLSVLPCGKLPGNPSELLTRPEYEELLEVLRQKFDFVVIDTPPVLVVTDSSSVAPRVDAVIMCMRLSRHTRDLGRRAMDQLRDIGADVVGMVINGVVESDAYGYGSYNYSDYRGSSYYGYRYGSEAYFADDKVEIESDPGKTLIADDEGNDSDPVKHLNAQGDEDV
jgi:capsular exopolysaccharide synthesis family protein